MPFIVAGTIVVSDGRICTESTMHHSFLDRGRELHLREWRLVATMDLVHDLAATMGSYDPIAHGLEELVRLVPHAHETTGCQTQP